MSPPPAKLNPPFSYRRSKQSKQAHTCGCVAGVVRSRSRRPADAQPRHRPEKRSAGEATRLEEGAIARGRSRRRDRRARADDSSAAATISSRRRPNARSPRDQINLLLSGRKSWRTVRRDRRGRRRGGRQKSRRHLDRVRRRRHREAALLEALPLARSHRRIRRRRRRHGDNYAGGEWEAWAIGE